MFFCQQGPRMYHEFELPNDVPDGEECALGIRFTEVRLHGSDEVRFEVLAYEMYADVEVFALFEFDSCTDMKRGTPTLLDWLVTLARHPAWDSAWRGYDRVYYLAEIEGADTLYQIDPNNTIWIHGKEIANKSSCT